MILTTLTALILCHALQRKSEKCIKTRGARAEPSLMNPLFLDVLFGSVIARESFNMHKPLRTATSSTLYPKNSFIQIARYRRPSLDSRGIFDSGCSLQSEFILLSISHTTFRHWRERSYPPFGQPFPKQLYTVVVRTFALTVTAHPYYAPKFSCHVMHQCINARSKYNEQW